MESWKAFIEAVTQSESEGLAPYIHRIDEGFETVFQTIATIRQSLIGLRFRTDVISVGLQNCQDGAAQLRDEITAVIESPPDGRFDGFVPAAFRKRVSMLMHAISDLFDHGLRHSGLTVGTTVACRTALASAVAEIAIAFEMVHQHGGTFDALRAQIYDVNHKLTRLFEKLRFPFTIMLIVHGQPARARRSVTETV